MHRAPSSHATHDELLLARFYGGDVDEPEREKALDQIASCSECADFFADLGSIARATAALPVPARPRDFTLTEADAKRLRRSGLGRVSEWLYSSRGVARSMVAVGVAGFMVVGVISAFTPATQPVNHGRSAQDYGAATAALAPVMGPTSAPAFLSGSGAPASPAPVPASSAGDNYSSSGSGGPVIVTPPPALVTPAATALAPVALSSTQSGEGDKRLPESSAGGLAVSPAVTQASSAPVAPSAPSSTAPGDPGAGIRLVLMMAFAVVALAGFAFLVVGRMRTRQTTDAG